MTAGHYLLGSGDRYYLVPNQKSHDLRRSRSRHVKTDAVDAEALARIGLMAPEALRPVRLDPKYQSLGRWVRRHYRRNRALGELKRSFWSLVEELLPGVGRVIDDPLSVAGRAFFRRYANPFAVLRLGSRRFTQAMERAAGQYGKPETIAGLYALCERAVELHRQAARGLDLEDLAEDLLPGGDGGSRGAAHAGPAEAGGPGR